MSKSRYKSLPQDELVLDGHRADGPPLKVTKPRPQASRLWVLAFVVSVCFNGFLFLDRVLPDFTGMATAESPDSSFIRFQHSFDLPFPNRSHVLENDLLLDDPRFNLERGFVAVDTSVAEAYGFPRAQPWPWDETKGIYLLNSWHNLHCVVALRKSIKFAFAGNEQNDQGQLRHLLHCLRILSDDILCAADDTLRYTGPLYEQVNASVPHSGFGQKRKCRNWDELYDWAMQNSACYNDKRDQPDLPELERYKFCPDGAEPWKDAL